MIKIGKCNIGLDFKPFVIAEMSGNHNRSLESALEIVEAAAKIGAHALKLQTYTPDTITLNLNDGDFYIKEKNSLWKGKSLYELYKEAYTPWEWHEPIFQRANELNLMCFSTPFDDSSVDYLENLNVPAYKIASFESCHFPLLRKVAKTGKPMIISTGMSTISEINDTVTTIKDAGCDKFVLLKCTSNYPASVRNSNVLTIPHMREMFNCEVGLSDHTMGIGASIAAVSHGATVVEKHLTMKRSNGGVDSSFSMEPAEMANLVVETENAWKALGDITYGPSAEEEKSMIFRRSIYLSEDVKKNQILNENNIKIIRPGYGLHPKFFDIILGSKIKSNAKKGTALSWDLII